MACTASQAATFDVRTARPHRTLPRAQCQKKQPWRQNEGQTARQETALADPCAEISSVRINAVTATEADGAAADAIMRRRLNNPAWKKPDGYVWNHAGMPGSQTMELVDARFHRLAHKGSIAELR